MCLSANGQKRTFGLEISLISVILTILLLLPTIHGVLISSFSVYSSGHVQCISPLHTEGRYIKNSSNRTIILRGVNQEGFLDHPNGWWNPEGGGYSSGLGVWNPETVKYNLNAMKSWGLNVLRIHTNIQWWKYDDSSYRQHIKDTITWAGEIGMYVIFEPYAVTGADHREVPWPPYIPESQWDIVPDEQAFVTYWASVATELKDYSNVLFEIYNEPHGNTTVRDVFFDITQQCIDAIRAVGADNIIIVQWGYGIYVNLSFPGDYGSMNWVEQYPLIDPQDNIVYSFHNYRGDFHRTDPTRVNVWEYDDIKAALQYCLVEYVLNNLSKPVLVGEIGANMWFTGDALIEELAYFNNSLTIYDEWNMSYLAWVWTIPAHMRYGLLQNDAAWLPPPNKAGEILIAKGKP